jgi:NAD(P)H-flavin reductase
MPGEPKKLTASLRTVTPQIQNVVTLRLDLQLRFKPSQAVGITFPGDSKKRYFSISSAPNEGPYIEVTVKSEPGTPLAQALAALKRGDILEVEGPVGGSLAVEEPVTAPLVFIAAGTGAAPFRSVIRSLLDAGITQPIYLLHSVKRKADLLFMKDFQNWSGKKKNFKYVPTITQDYDDDWKNETGRIQDTLLFKHLPDTPNHYYLCGPTNFVNDMEKILLENLKVAPERIRREKW